MARMSINRVEYEGWLGADPSMKYTPDGTAITNFNIGIGMGKKDTMWRRIVCFGGTAETTNKYLKKGSHVIVFGREQESVWKDNNDQKRVTVEVVARDVTFLDKPPGDSGEKQAKPQASESTEGVDTPSDDDAFPW